MRNNTFYNKNISYQVDRYEEWQSGHCINNGEINLIVTGNINNDKIIFSIDGAYQLHISNNFDFNICESCILNDGRIQYVKAPENNINPMMPVVCHLFIRNNQIDYIRFAMTNPDRLIEFHGHS